MTLPLKLNADSNLPPFRQIADQLRAIILSEALAAGEQLPSVREIAANLSVNPLTVARAINELEAAGLVESRWGKGNFVRDLTPSQLKLARKRAFASLVNDFLRSAHLLGFTREDAAKMIRTSSFLSMP